MNDHQGYACYVIVGTTVVYAMRREGREGKVVVWPTASIQGEGR